MNFIDFEGNSYPKFQAEGNASQFAIPFAKHFCKGIGYDIGCNRLDWKLDGAIPIDPLIDSSHDALKLPPEQVDYIYSSHCLEHLDSWIDALEYWTKNIRSGGVLFLYLPDFSQTYWRPWNNKKHKHILDPNHIKEYMKKLGYDKILVSGVDLNNSFIIVGIKK
jgi:predicted SAM-dependent methyltransferase